MINDISDIDFSNVNSKSQILKIEQLLRIYSVDMEVYRTKYDSDNPVMDNLFSDQKDEICRSLNNLINDIRQL